MKYTYFAFALVLLNLSATAQDKKDVASEASTSVLINGQRIRGKVLEIDGKHFVAVEDLAQSLRGTITYGDGQIALTLSKLTSIPAPPPPSQPPSIAAPPAASQLPSVTAPTTETGSVTGTLTYFVDFHNGSKP